MTPTPEQIERALVRWAKAEAKWKQDAGVSLSVYRETGLALRAVLRLGRALLAKRSGK